MFEFPDLPFFDDIVPFEKIGKEFTFPMKVFVCLDCYLVQSLHNVDIAEYYVDYSYNASESFFTREYMVNLAKKAWSEYGFEKGDEVIDIGAADGFQLKCFLELGARVLGYEPAHNLVKIASGNGIDMIAQLFDEDSIKFLPLEFKKVKCVTLLHTLDHLQKPSEILENIAKILDKKSGILIIEVHDLEQMFENQETALFGHEHTVFLNYHTIRNLLNRAGYKIINYNFIDEKLRRGTSMVIVAALDTSNYKTATLPTVNIKYNFDNLDTYIDFTHKIENAFARLKKYIASRRVNNLRLVGYGGWGRGVTFLSMAELDSNDLVAICDQNPVLHGNFTPGTNIPIVHPDFLLNNSIDEVIVFNHAYLPEIIAQQKLYIEKGGKVVSVISILRGECD
jgi:hypothetical protein